MTIFESNELDQKELFLVDERLTPSELEFVVYQLGDRLTKISLTTDRPSTTFLDYSFGIVNEKLRVNGGVKIPGYHEIDGLNFLVLSRENAKTTFFVINETDDFVISQDLFAGIKIQNSLRIVLHQDSLILETNNETVYYNDVKVKNNGSQFVPIQDGMMILTPDFLLEKRPKQWKLTCFSDDIILDTKQLLIEEKRSEFPLDFPNYRRSPRLNLEVPIDNFTLQVIEQPKDNNKNGLLKTVLPPLAMIGMTGATTILSGRNPIMLLSMGAMSVLTTSFTLSQYFSDKKASKLENDKRHDDYNYYLINTVSEISKAYEQEKMVLDFQLPTPENLVGLISDYNSRIYERQRYNKDFLTVSLGNSDQKSNLTISSDVNAKDLSDEAKHLKDLVQQFSTQRNVATPISLLDQTLGLVGTQDILKTTLESLLLQTAFFHSYRDVNFISLLPRKAYNDTWRKWRMLPHFKLQELNMRGLIYNEKLRDVVLNSFNQLLNKRKQALNEAGKEKPVFSPHYVFTIVDDTLLAGHGMNELLAEDMSDLGVTVIWCKEDKNQLPETVVSVVEIPNSLSGQLVSDHTTYLAKNFKPYETIPNLENSLRKLANLNHLEVEKNGVPDSLSLLEQYEVKKVEELEISDRWAKAEPNKSIKSLIGWRGKSDYVYWDLHERAHGPHALAAGTTGSGKSEFLTTYSIGLAINFSPEDIGILIIDWKGGGIANTLSKLPHFMGAITNLDGAGTARALASIKAELQKRQREFAKYGVNNINDYMSLYKQRHNPKPGIKYPTKPLPHLIIISDEFAELKANVPEFLDELTSVARIGRSLGVHLILATQNPSGIVNEQIESNSRSKVALKMADEANSNEVLKTPDAAHITNPGRGYLKVGQNEVYELFQSGYAGVPYDSEADNVERVDERLYRLNDLGQRVLIYDPDEEVVQGKDTSDLPTQLEEVISEVGRIFEQTNYALPDRPWLPNLENQIPSPRLEQSEQRNLSVPLGLLDIPSKQTQEVYDFNIEHQGHTAIFASPGYGKSTILQTLVLSLSRQNSPETTVFNLFDFGNNGLLPLKDLPHVADIVTLEEDEKLQKMLLRTSTELAHRKQLFKNAGVANLTQYENKTKETLPVIINVLDSYDGLSPNDKRKDTIDNLLIQLLRDGASLGLYLVITANRVGGIRMNMMSNIATKIALFLNEESEVSTIMGRERVVQEATNGRGQVMHGVPTAIQFYLPVAGQTDSEILKNLEQTVEALDKEWTGKRPDKIPMVPDELTVVNFEEMPEIDKLRNIPALPLGLSKTTTDVLGYIPNRQPYFLVSATDGEQQLLIQRLLLTQLSKTSLSVLLIDFNETFEETLDMVSLSKNIKLIKDKEDAREIVAGIVGYLTLAKQKEQSTSMTVIISDLSDFIAKTGLKVEDFVLALKNTNKAGLSFIIFSPHEYIARSYDGAPKALRTLKYSGLIGARAYDSPLIKFQSNSQEPEVSLDEVYYVMRGGAVYDKMRLPKFID